MIQRERERTPVALVAHGRSDERSAAWLLCVVHGDSAGQRLSVPADGLVLGRQSGDGVTVLSETEASRRHCGFELNAEGELTVRDLESTNGTWVNGRRVTAARLSVGAILRVGRTLLVVSKEGAVPTPGRSPLLGTSPAIEEVRRLVRLSAPSSLPVLILGQTGTGKELVASGLHEASGRRGAFVAVNAAALPASLVESALFGHRRGAFTDARTDEPGAFVRAHEGTLFLDEIGEMPQEAQAKLLRTLETGEVLPVGASRPVKVTVRVVAATHRTATGQGAALREDLYARLAGVVIRTPPLADRREDILPLFRAFLGPQAAQPVSVDFAEALLFHGWPRNVRELKRVAERLTLLAGAEPLWERHHLGPDFDALTTSASDDDADDGATANMDSDHPWPPTRESLVALLDACDGNVSLAAERVGRNRKQIYRWREKFGV
ncbi:MAG: sigma 54-interacting transcriptional regulator [Myxococcales bacterium]|nr:sigma 54-interacting transcriptional regulator [Myxococcales bacterium]